MPDHRLRRRRLTISEILAWADRHRESHGKWPTRASGMILGARFETWAQVDTALRQGQRGLPGGSSLAKLLACERGAHNRFSLPALAEPQILVWADEYQQRTGKWPTAKAGSIPGSGGETWTAVDTALRMGLRSLAGGSSLAQLLALHRGVRNGKSLPPLTLANILAWADAHLARTGAWPALRSGAILEAPGETWYAIQAALRHGQRGLPGGSSLALLLAEQRGARNVWTRPDLAIERVLAWADAFHERSGEWPSNDAGAIPEAPGETWQAVSTALQRGSRGLPQVGSLAQWLARERGVRNPEALPKLQRRTLLVWADAHFHRTGQWPTEDAGAIPEAPGETWQAVASALRNGGRGLRGGSSLARLLAAHERKRNSQDLPPLTRKQILTWADAYHERTGRWPNRECGPIDGAPGETWLAVDMALRKGHRGQPGGSSLLRLLVKRRGVRNRLCQPALSAKEIWQWASAHQQRTGAWPTVKDGPLVDAPGETWVGINGALRLGKRGLPGGSSLAQFLASQKTAPASRDAAGAGDAEVAAP